MIWVQVSDLVALLLELGTGLAHSGLEGVDSGIPGEMTGSGARCRGGAMGSGGLDLALNGLELWQVREEELLDLTPTLPEHQGERKSQRYHHLLVAVRWL